MIANTITLIVGSVAAVWIMGVLLWPYLKMVSGAGELRAKAESMSFPGIHRA